MLTKQLKDDLEYHRTTAANSNLQIPGDEFAKLKAVITEQCAVRCQGMVGNDEAIEAHCLDQSLATIDLRAICPKFHAMIRDQRASYSELIRHAREGLAHANVLSRILARERPELETLESLVQSYLAKLKPQLKEGH